MSLNSILKVYELQGPISVTKNFLELEVPKQEADLNKGKWTLYIRDLTVVNDNPNPAAPNVYFTLTSSLCHIYQLNQNKIPSLNEVNLGRFEYQNQKSGFVSFPILNYYITNPSNTFQIKFKSNPALTFADFNAHLSICLQRIV